MPETTSPTEPLLRILVPELRRLEQHLRTWLAVPHQFPIEGTKLEELAHDLGRQAGALDSTKPLLIILLMGGTGVGKSTLLNALAGGAIAQASYVRPTTRDPVVYFHESIRPERLPPELQQCKLAAHDRPNLEQKVIVDTPDLDSNDLANREKLRTLLPVADVVLYVGSQEKYHDRLGWELFQEQRQRRGFAFILNKWDRCLHGQGGVRPDEDLLRDLESAGFEHPLLFRTCAQYWLDRSQNGTSGTPLEGEQFQDLVRWLETGLTEREIEAIKACGVLQLQGDLEQTLSASCPPDLTEAAGPVRAAWESILNEEAEEVAGVLVNSLEPYQREIEHHFAWEGQRRFRGMMAIYLRLITRAKYLGSTLTRRIPFLPRSESVQTPASLELASLTGACSSVAGDRHLDARARALPNRLLIEAGQHGFPVSLLNDAVEATVQLDWRGHYAQVLAEILQEVEREWSQPVGAGRWLQVGFIWLANWLPPVFFIAACASLFWRYFVKELSVGLFDFVLIFLMLILVLMLLHLLTVLILPMRWQSIRGQFERRLQPRVRALLESTYAPIPGEVASSLAHERQGVEELLAAVNQVQARLKPNEEAAEVSQLYGTPAS
jgi:hypothetical protein